MTPAPTESVAASARKTLLLVDDESATRELLAHGVEQLGYVVRIAGSVEEALDIVRREPVHLVLADVELPGGSGIELLRRIKAHDDDVDVVMVSRVVDLATAIGSIRDGASEYVTKPFSLAEIRIVVERTLERRRLILENRAYQQRLEDQVEERTRDLLKKKCEIEVLYGDLQGAYESTLQALVTALDFRDNETQGHSSRVVEYAIVIARRMGIDEAQYTWIRQGAMLHDVGKIGVPDAVLKKPGKLTPDEWEEMKRHPEMGYRMLEHIRFLAPALNIVLSHQERWDGSGYPQGLKGDEIPLGSRIFAVVDTFDAMTSDRPYRKALSVEAARDEMRRFSGIQFDPRVAEAFLSIDEDLWGQIRERVHRHMIAVEEQVRIALGRPVPTG